MNGKSMGSWSSAVPSLSSLRRILDMHIVTKLDRLSIWTNLPFAFGMTSNWRPNTSPELKIWFVLRWDLKGSIWWVQSRKVKRVVMKLWSKEPLTYINGFKTSSSISINLSLVFLSSITLPWWLNLIAWSSDTWNIMNQARWRSKKFKRKESKKLFTSRIPILTDSGSKNQFWSIILLKVDTYWSEESVSLATFSR